MIDRTQYMREVKVEDAVGMVLAHDLTRIDPGKFKGRLFQKGHVIQQSDIPSLLDIGKEHIYILDLLKGIIHEDEAANRLAKAFSGKLVEASQPHEGKVNIISRIQGLAKIDKAFVEAVNALDEIVMATIRTNTVVSPGQALVGTRITPLVIEEEKIEAVEALARKNKQAAVDVRPFRSLQVAVIITGNEVFHGRIEDRFGPVVKRKLEALGSKVMAKHYVPDDRDEIVRKIHDVRENGAELILLTGGMSVDPDDRTPGAIRRSGADIVRYGTPMLPGSMLLMAYLDEIPVMGLPGCVMHDPFTSFDVLLPRICAGEVITEQDIIQLGYGGYTNC